jgi:hypothetical protein
VEVLLAGRRGVERTARLLRDMAAEQDSIDWRQLGAPRGQADQRTFDDDGSPLAAETRPENPPRA